MKLLLLTLLLSALGAGLVISYSLSLATMQTTETFVPELAKARNLAAECKGAHKVTLAPNGWKVTCRELRRKSG